MAVPDETRERAAAPPATRPPYAAYAGIMGTFAGVLGATGLLARALGRDPRHDAPLDLAVLSIATFKAARMISWNDVTSFIRAPFVEGEAGRQRRGAGRDRRPPAGDRRARDVQPLRRYLGGSGLATTQILAPGSDGS